MVYVSVSVWRLRAVCVSGESGENGEPHQLIYNPLV